jgi:signal transduction histidine kinase
MQSETILKSIELPALSRMPSEITEPGKQNRMSLLSIFDFLKKVEYPPEYEETSNLILKKSFLFSAVAAVLAKKINHLNPDECYASGLLADIGQILLFLYAPARYHKIYSPADKKLIEKERATFQIDHIQLGAAFCEQRDFPGYIKTGIINHFEPGSDAVHSKIVFVANQITELLLTRDESDMQDIFPEVEDHAEKLLHLSLPEVEEAVKSLPHVMQTYMKDFPEMQKDLHEIAATGASLIVTLIKKERGTRELSEYKKELEQTRKSLQRLQKSAMVGEMLPVILHKLKNKITPIIGYAQILLTRVQDESIRQKVFKIEKNADELTDQLNSLRDYFKSDGWVKEKENLNRIINDLKPYFNELKTVENISIHLDLGPEVPRGTLIPGQIEMLVTHLVENAVLAIREKVAKGECKEGDGIITIKTRRTPDADTYILSIRDNGIGIEGKEVHNIWVPFYSQFPDRGGLGLSICEKIIANHGASHSIESVKSEFLEVTVTFPFKEKPAAEEEQGYIGGPAKKIPDKLPYE